MIVMRGELLFLRTSAIEYSSPFVRIFHEMLVNILEIGQLASSIELSVEIRPLIIRNPCCGIGRDSYFSSWSRKKVSPLSTVDLIVSLFDLDG